MRAIVLRLLDSRSVRAAIVLAFSVGISQAQVDRECENQRNGSTAESNKLLIAERARCAPRDAQCAAAAGERAEERNRQTSATYEQCVIDRRARAAGMDLKPQTPQLDPRMSWTQSGDQSVYTDQDGIRWSFPGTVVDGQYRWILERGTVDVKKVSGELRQVDAQYREQDGKSLPRRMPGTQVRP